MARVKRRGHPRKKVVRNVEKKTRCRYTIAHKAKAIYLHETGMSLKQIRQWFIDNEKLSIKTSTICTWYTPENIKKMKALGQLSDTNRDTCINPQQRPRIAGRGKVEQGLLWNTRGYYGTGLIFKNVFIDL